MDYRGFGLPLTIEHENLLKSEKLKSKKIVNSQTNPKNKFIYERRDKT